MKDTYQIAVVLHLVDGAQARVRLKAFENQEDAEKERDELRAGVGPLLKIGAVIATEPNGEKVGPIPLGQVLGTVGLVGIDFVVYKVPLHSGVVLTAVPNIITLQ